MADSDQNRKIAVGLALAAVLGTGFIAGLYALSLDRGSTTTGSTLPAGCVRPANGFLLIASDGGPYGVGYNDSKGHGAPGTPWPVITVNQGTTITITVCNIDVQAHSFNIIHYLEGAANTIGPGQVRTFTITAAQTGTFVIYCDIFCSIHIFMQAGQLRVE